MNETSGHGPVVRDRYRPAEFEAERYSPENLSFWMPIVVRLGHIQHDDEVLDLGCGTGGLTAAVAERPARTLRGAIDPWRCSITDDVYADACRRRGYALTATWMLTRSPAATKRAKSGY